MRVFRAVVEEGAFACAARRLRVSNAAVSKHVAALEDVLATRLLHRTTRSLGLTSAGRAYYNRATRLLDELEELEREMRAEGDEPTGELRVAVPMSLGLARIAPALPKFLAAYPKVRIDLSLTDRNVDVVEEGVDVALRVAGVLPDSTLIGKRLGPMARVVVAAPEYLEANGELKTPADLKGHACIRYTRLSNPSTWTLRGPGGEVSVAVSGNLSVDNSLAMRGALIAAAGIALTPTFVVQDDLRSGRLVRCLKAWEPEPRSVFAVYPAPRHLSPKLRAFLTFAKGEFVS